MKRVTGIPLLLCLLFASVVGAAPPDPPFKLPVSPIVPSPMPSAVTTLAEGQVFVIQREADFRVYEGVAGAVSVKLKKLTKGQSHSIDGVFVDGTGQREEREYVGTESGIFIAVIRPLKDGPVDVILAPRLATEDWEIRLPLTVKMGQGPCPPPKTEPTPTPKTPEPAPSYYFLVIRPNGPASAEFTRIMGLPGWAALATAGHKFKDKTIAEASAIGITIADGTVLPCVVTLKVSADGKTSDVVRGPVAIPADPAKLAEGVK